MAGSEQKGFIPCRKLSGGHPVLKTFPVSAASSKGYFIGQAVGLGANGKAKTLAADAGVLGVVCGVYKNVDNKPAPLTFNQPSNGNFLATAQEGFVLVNTDPHQTYTAQADVNFTQAIVGAGIDVSAGTDDVKAGISGQELAGAVSTSADSHFQILGLAPLEDIQAVTSVAAPVILEVIPANTIIGTPI